MTPEGRCPRRADATDLALGSLRGPRRQAFERHLATCRECREDLAGLSALVGSLRESRDAFAGEPRAELAREVLLRLAPEANEGRARARIPELLAGLAAALIAGAALWVGLELRGLPDPPALVSPFAAPPSPTPSRETTAHRGRRELALLRGRRWLVQAQDADGSWSPARWGGDPSFRVALSGLSVLVLARSEDSTERDAARRGAERILVAQDASGLLGPPIRAALYNQALGALALAEARRAGLLDGRDDEVGRPLERLASAASSRGGWGYLGPDGARTREEDRSITAWSLRALRAAQAAGLAVPGGVLERTLASIDGGASVAATMPGAREAGGDLAGQDLAELAWAEDQVLRAMDDSHLPAGPFARWRWAASDREAADWSAVANAEPVAPLVSDAGSNAGALTQLRREALDVLAHAQQVEGPLLGSWAPSRASSAVGGRAYATALAALALSGGPRL